jgi:hypothetical protein
MSSVIDLLLDPQRVSLLLGVEVETLGVWRRRGYGPRWYRVGKKIKYSMPDIEGWMTAQAGSGATIAAQGDPTPVMTGDQLTATLARRIMCWGVGPNRFLKGQRRWAPRWHFQPLRRLDHALQLLDKANSQYTLTKSGDGAFMARVSVGERQGFAAAKSEAAALTLALASAIGILADLLGEQE